MWTTIRIAAGIMGCFMACFCMLTLGFAVNDFVHQLILHQKAKITFWEVSDYLHLLIVCLVLTAVGLWLGWACLL